MKAVAIFLLFLTAPADVACGTPAVTIQDAAPGPVPANRCRVVGVITAWRAADPAPRLPVPDGATLITIDVEITTVEEIDPTLPCLSSGPGIMVLVTTQALLDKLEGVGFSAEIELVGSTRQRDWWTRTLQPEDPTSDPGLRRPT